MYRICMGTALFLALTACGGGGGGGNENAGVGGGANPQADTGFTTTVASVFGDTGDSATPRQINGVNYANSGTNDTNQPVAVSNP